MGRGLWKYEGVYHGKDNGKDHELFSWQEGQRV